MSFHALRVPPFHLPDHPRSMPILDSESLRISIRDPCKTRPDGHREGGLLNLGGLAIATLHKQPKGSTEWVGLSTLERQSHCEDVTVGAEPTFHIQDTLVREAAVREKCARKDAENQQHLRWHLMGGA